MKRCYCAVLLMLLLFSGCGTVTERAVVQTLAIDRAGEDWLVSVCLLSTGEAREERYFQAGETIADAVASLEKGLGKTLFLRDTRLILLGEELCARGVGSCMRYLTGGFEIRPGAVLAAAQGEAKAYLTGAQTLLSALQDAGTTVLELDRDMKASGGDGFLPLLTLDEQGTAGLSGAVVLHKEKTSHRIRQEEMFGIALLFREPEETVVLSLDGGQAVLSLERWKRSLRAEITEDVPVFTMTCRGDFTLAEWTGEGDPPGKETLETALRLKMTELLEEALGSSVFAAGADLLQMDSILRRDVPRWYAQNEAFWREHRETAIFIPVVRCIVEER